MLGSGLIWELQGCWSLAIFKLEFFSCFPPRWPAVGKPRGFWLTLSTQQGQIAGQGPTRNVYNFRLKTTLLKLEYMVLDMAVLRPGNCSFAERKLNVNCGLWVWEQALVTAIWPRGGHNGVGIVGGFLNSSKGFKLVWASLPRFIFLSSFLFFSPFFAPTTFFYITTNS